MGKLNEGFKYDTIFNVITLLVLIIFLALFVQSIITVIGVFETDFYSDTIADLGQMNN